LDSCNAQSALPALEGCAGVGRKGSDPLTRAKPPLRGSTGAKSMPKLRRCAASRDTLAWAWANWVGPMAPSNSLTTNSPSGTVALPPASTVAVTDVLRISTGRIRILSRALRCQTGAPFVALTVVMRWKGLGFFGRLWEFPDHQRSVVSANRSKIVFG